MSRKPDDSLDSFCVGGPDSWTDAIPFERSQLPYSNRSRSADPHTRALELTQLSTSDVVAHPECGNEAVAVLHYCLSDSILVCFGQMNAFVVESEELGLDLLHPFLVMTVEVSVEPTLAVFRAVYCSSSRSLSSSSSKASIFSILVLRT